MAVPFVKCYNQTEAELGVFTDEHYPNGYRFTSLSIYGTLADPLYAAGDGLERRSRGAGADIQS